MRLIFFILLAWGFLFEGIPVHAQIKYEREYKLNLSEVPPMARSFVDSCKFSSRIKWYKEESEAGNSVEAKVREAGILFSIEFGTGGEIQDVEVDIKLQKIDPNTRKAFEEELEKIFKKYRIQRIQVQWTGSRKSLLYLIRNENIVLRKTRKYELIVKGKKEKKHALYEILFGEQLKIERIAKIKTRNTDNMDF